LPDVDQIIETGEPLPTFHQHSPVMSLPYALGTTRNSIPANVPYLSADPIDVENWRRRVATTLGTSGELKVGICWAGNPDHTSDCKRSIPLDQLAPSALLARDGMRFHSLQAGTNARGMIEQCQAMNIADHSSQLNDFADTAALIANLDLVISVDTAVAHLAGAMGKPVWLLLPFLADWRWMAKGKQSPWYPTMRLYRQDRDRSWPGVINEVAKELAGEIHRHRTMAAEKPPRP
jgi:hypothetical protein